MRVGTTIAGSAVALVGALGITAGLGLSGASGSTGTEAPLAAAAPAVLPVASGAPSAVAAPPRVAVPAAVTSHVTTRTAPTHATATRSASSTDSAPCGLTDGACVSLSKRRAWLVRDGRVVLSAPITTGRPGERTPPGTFHVTWKDADHLSSEFHDAPMPWSVFFNGGIAFHTGSLSRQSAGCVHLSDSAARTFFRTLRVGDTVIVAR
jgi:lipoprotein-anchoring transpeptidase ErfK/SrfK